MREFEKLHTFNMLDTEFLNKTRREHPGCERTTEDIAKLRIKTTNTHILKFEVWGKNRIRSCPNDSNKFKSRLDAHKVKVHFLLLDLILMALVGSLTKLTSVFSMRIPVF
jgi:hypothetical protein